MAFSILYHDEFIVAINKPEGWLVHRSLIDKHETRFVLQTLRDQLGAHVYPVHRLDKPTSGVLLFALNADIARQLAVQFETHQIEKYYDLLCRGHIEKSGLIDHALVPKNDFKSKRNKNIPAKPPQDAQTGYLCQSLYTLGVCVDKYPTSRYSLVQAKPVTGRKHQIRRHFKHIAHPIIGDPKYGKSSHNRYFKTTFGCQRLMLHCSSMGFEHPVSKQWQVVASKRPDSFNQVLEQLAAAST